MCFTETAIGGYHDLSSNAPDRGLLPGGHRLDSARNALHVLLTALRPECVWLPRYLCDSMYRATENAGVRYRTYGLTEALRPDADLRIGPGDVLVYANYFGVCSDAEADVVKRFGAERVILDRSQAWFARRRLALAEIYSPRKFFGVPDGGLLVTDTAVELPGRADDAGAVEPAVHLLRRLAAGPEAGYADYRAAEDRVAACAPAAMSALTERLLTRVDADWAARERRKNFRCLHEYLGGDNALALVDPGDEVPMCYPYLSRRHAVDRAALTHRRVYVPKYWEEVLARTDASAFERSLARDGLALPCDQRYGTADMERLMATLRAVAT